MTFRKAEYISDFARKVKSGNFDLDAIWKRSDDEMILLFCMQRSDVSSFGDLAILRGMRMVYHHRKINRKLFEKYRRRLSPSILRITR